MKILILRSGLGGTRAKMGNKHEITAVEIDPKIAGVYSDNFPHDEVIVGDANDFLLKNHHLFDAVFDSPPCPTHSRMMKATRHDVRAFPDMTLYQVILFLKHFFKGKWVVENVIPYYEPLIKPTVKIGRHLFWSNFDIFPIEHKTLSGFITNDSPDSIQKMKDWLGIQYEGNIYVNGNHSPGQVLRNCMHPDIGLHLLNEMQRVGMFNPDSF